MTRRLRFGHVVALLGALGAVGCVSSSVKPTRPAAPPIHAKREPVRIAEASAVVLRKGAPKKQAAKRCPAPDKSNRPGCPAITTDLEADEREAFKAVSEQFVEEARGDLLARADLRSRIIGDVRAALVAEEQRVAKATHRATRTEGELEQLLERYGAFPSEQTPDDEESEPTEGKPKGVDPILLAARAKNKAAIAAYEAAVARIQAEIERLERCGVPKAKSTYTPPTDEELGFFYFSGLESNSRALVVRRGCEWTGVADTVELWSARSPNGKPLVSTVVDVGLTFYRIYELDGAQLRSIVLDERRFTEISPIVMDGRLVAFDGIADDGPARYVWDGTQFVPADPPRGPKPAREGAEP
jgi:hypothetical protein